MKIKLFMLLVAISTLIYSCNSGVEVNQDSNDTSELPAGVHKVTVEEIIQANAYTYLRVKENDAELWLAIGKREVKQGGTYYYDGALEMKDFESKELGRVFESIYFIDQIRDKAEKDAEKIMGSDVSPGAIKTEKTEIKVEKADGGVTIEELFANKATYAGQKVKIKGQIVKVNLAIMGKNWIHIQDGTASGESFDLTITTAEEFQVDEVVTFEGTITLDKDFGAGYFYDVIMEEATSIKE